MHFEYEQRAVTNTMCNRKACNLWNTLKPNETGQYAIKLSMNTLTSTSSTLAPCTLTCYQHNMEDVWPVLNNFIVLCLFWFSVFLFFLNNFLLSLTFILFLPCFSIYFNLPMGLEMKISHGYNLTHIYMQMFINMYVPFLKINKYKYPFRAKSTN